MDPNELLKRLEPVKDDLGLQIHVAELQPEAVVSEPPPKPHARLTCHGADKIGIVHKITQFLADQSINIIDLHTTVLRRAKPEYIMELTLEMPSYTNIDQLGRDLTDLGKQLKIDIVLRP
jgi:glycine cleavage system regulatory protein